MFFLAYVVLLICVDSCHFFFLCDMDFHMSKQIITKTLFHTSHVVLFCLSSTFVFELRAYELCLVS